MPSPPARRPPTRAAATRIASRVARTGRGSTADGPTLDEHRGDARTAGLREVCRGEEVGTRLAQVGTRLERVFFSEHRGCSNCSNLFQPLSSSGEKSEKNLNIILCEKNLPKARRSFGRLEHGTVGTKSSTLVHSHQRVGHRHSHRKPLAPHRPRVYRRRANPRHSARWHPPVERRFLRLAT